VARASLLLAAALALAGCAPPTPTPPPTFARVAASPMLEPLAARWLTAYREAIGAAPFDLEPVAEAALFDAVRPGGHALALTAVEPPTGWFAAPVASEAIAVLVHPDNPLRSLTLEQVADLFTGRAASWEAMGGPDRPVQPVIALAGEGLRKRFEAAALRGAPAAPGAWLAPTPAAMLELVAGDPGAVGYLYAGLVDDSVCAVRLEGTLPTAEAVASGRYPLVVTILATAPEEPAGGVRDWLVWMQAGG
jgi:hypothetical protein